MDVSEAIGRRRAYRSLDPVPINKKMITDLAEHARMAPSCFNNQPWRFVFVYGKERLREMQAALTKGNRWAHKASMIIAVFSKEDDDCVIRDRTYHQFDCGLAVGSLILRATELGLIAHPIAGFSPKKTRNILGIPVEYKVITLVMIGRKAKDVHPELSPEQVRSEKRRPRRKSLRDIAFINRFGKGL